MSRPWRRRHQANLCPCRKMSTRSRSPGCVGEPVVPEQQVGTSTWRNSPAIWGRPARGAAWTAGRPTRLGTIAPEHAFNLRLGPVAVHRCPAGVALGHDFTPVGDAPPPEEASPSQSPPPPEDVRPVTQHSPAGDVRATHFPVSSRIAAIRRAVFAKCSTSSGSNSLPRTLLSR